MTEHCIQYNFEGKTLWVSFVSDLEKSDCKISGAQCPMCHDKYRSLMISQTLSHHSLITVVTQNTIPHIPPSHE